MVDQMGARHRPGGDGVDRGDGMERQPAHHGQLQGRPSVFIQSCKERICGLRLIHRKSARLMNVILTKLSNSFAMPQWFDTDLANERLTPLLFGSYAVENDKAGGYSASRGCRTIRTRLTFPWQSFNQTISPRGRSISDMRSFARRAWRLADLWAHRRDTESTRGCFPARS
jgi:hypothetical protein